MQNDLISRSALIAHIGDLGIDPEDDTTFLTTGQACAIAHKCIVEMVKEEPAVDAVEVVRCKNCKHWHEKTGWCYHHSHFVTSDGEACHPWESVEWKMFEENDFCSYGERRADDGV